MPELKPFDQFLHEHDVVPDNFYEQVMEPAIGFPSDLASSFAKTVGPWAPESITQRPIVCGEQAEEVEAYRPTKHELTVLARYWTEKQLDIRYLDLSFEGNLKRKFDPYAVDRISNIAEVLGQGAIEEVRSEVVSRVRSSIGEEHWKAFKSFVLDPDKWPR